MADKVQIKETAAMVLGCLETLSSFASSFNPLFGIVTSLIGTVRKGLVEDEVNELDKDFKQIHDKLESISVKNKKLLEKIQTWEINKNYGDLEKNIAQQYKEFLIMVEKIRKNPEKAEDYKKDFKSVYENQKGYMNLNGFYEAITGQDDPFGMPLLKDYLDQCTKDRKLMEAKCSHLAYVFQTGLIALVAYYVVTEDDEEEFREKWGPKVIEIQDKMQEALNKCSE